MLSLCSRPSRSTWRNLLRGFLSSPLTSLNSSWSIGNLESFAQHEEKDKSSFQSKSINCSKWYLVAAGFVAFNSSMPDYSSCLPLEEAQPESGYLQEEHTKTPRVVFVLGGPGSGKGTQCSKIAKEYGFSHLSAGELLRAEVNSGSQYGTMIQSTIKEGKIVPSEVTVRLLQKAMEESGNDKFLIDGFPRNEENRAAFETLTGIQPEFVIFFDCTEEEMERRALSRNQGRLDDNIDTIRERFKIYVESSLPVVEYYNKKEKLRKIDAVRDAENVFRSLKPLFKPFVEENLSRLTKKLLRCIDDGDYEVYRQLCDPALTAFEPESQGHLVEGLAFHKFYFGLERRLSVVSATQSLISAPRITLIGEDAALVTYTRLHQSTNVDGAPVVKAFNETRIWARKSNSQGMLEWRHTHFHRSECPCY